LLGNRFNLSVSSYALYLTAALAVSCLQVGETYNIGTQKERSVVDVATDICKVFKLDPATHVKHVKDRAFNDRRYFMCV